MVQRPETYLKRVVCKSRIVANNKNGSLKWHVVRITHRDRAVQVQQPVKILSELRVDNGTLNRDEVKQALLQGTLLVIYRLNLVTR